ncbi:MAG: MGMT family protein [Cytophagales bacterium]
MNSKNHNFFESVFEIVKLIPKGRVTSYGAIATYLGSAKSSRMVGWALNHSHAFADIPAHRVVNRIGMLTGKANFQYPTHMQELLEAENIKVLNDQIVNFEEIFWDPNIELRL